MLGCGSPKTIAFLRVSGHYPIHFVSTVSQGIPAI